MTQLQKQLLKWRGDRTEVKAASDLGIPVNTYRQYEDGRRTPRGLAMTALLERIGKVEAK